MDRPRRITSLDFGELDELLDDISCRNVTLDFDKSGKLKHMIAYKKGGLNDHIMDKMRELYDLDVVVIDPSDEDKLRLVFEYRGEYKNKAEYRKQLENEKEQCGAWNFDKPPYKWKIKKGMHKKYKELTEELKKYA